MTDARGPAWRGIGLEAGLYLALTLIFTWQLAASSTTGIAERAP